MQHEGQDRTSRGTLPSLIQTGEGFLLKFDLGPHVASLVMSTPLFVKLIMFGEGGAQVSGLCFRGPYQEVFSGAPCSNKDKDRRSRSTAKDKPGQDKHKRKHKGTSRTKEKARQGKPRQAEAKFKLQEETFTCLNQTGESSS